MNTGLATCFRIDAADRALALPESGEQLLWAPDPEREFQRLLAESDSGLASLPTEQGSLEAGVGLGRLARFLTREQAELELNHNLQFEALLAGMLARFMNLPAGEADREIVEALRRVGEFLGIDRVGLWCNSGPAGASFRLTHQYPLPADDSVAAPAEGSSPIGGNGTAAPSSPLPLLIGTESRTLFPWITAQVARGKAVVFSSLEQLPAEAGEDRSSLSRLQTRSGVVIPYLVENRVLGVMSYEAKQRGRAWPPVFVQRLEFISQVFANAITRKILDAEIRQLKERLQAESNYLKAEIKVIHSHGQIIAGSRAMKQVLHQVEQVAPADSAVLITGETGTGKELLAQSIHNLSRRKDRVMVKVNCAALPSPLVESELFGRERGAFTGALTKQVGRFELADNSTIFLDEVGDLSLEVQAKLLRVLQEGEFQRLGSPKTLKVNVRVIAATNRDLSEDVRKGRFREDLYYRLNVFPIQVPPLRERAEDIPQMVFAFLEELTSRMGKSITRVPRRAMEALQQHRWPGNIRQLRNVIEHSAILTSGETLKLVLLSDHPAKACEPVTLAEAERDHILSALEVSGWHIKGPRGAAGKLGLNPSTLYSRMQKLGIPGRREKHATPA